MAFPSPRPPSLNRHVPPEIDDPLVRRAARHVHTVDPGLENVGTSHPIDVVSCGSLRLRVACTLTRLPARGPASSLTESMPGRAQPDRRCLAFRASPLRLRVARILTRLPARGPASSLTESMPGRAQPDRRCLAFHASPLRLPAACTLTRLPARGPASSLTESMLGRRRVAIRLLLPLAAVSACASVQRALLQNPAIW